MPLKARVSGPVMEIDKLAKGQELPGMEILYDEDMQGRFLAALQEENPWYHRESPWGGPITYHPLLDDAPMESAMHCYQYPFSFVHAKQETEFIHPLPLGKPARVFTKIVDKPGFPRSGFHLTEIRVWVAVCLVMGAPGVKRLLNA